jgi:hypothetical protein
MSNYYKTRKQQETKAKVLRFYTWLGFFTSIGLLCLAGTYFYRAIMLLIEIL